MELFFQPFLTPKITISPIKSILLLKTKLFKLLLEYQDRDFRAIQTQKKPPKFDIIFTALKKYVRFRADFFLNSLIFA